MAPFVCALALGCSSGGQKSEPGVATIDFVPTLPTDTNLVLSSGDMHLSHIALAGTTPPPASPPMVQLDLDLESPGGVAMLDGLDPGTYSIVLIEYHAVMLAGTWKGTPFTAHVEPVDTPQVHVTAPMGQALGENENVAFTTDIDVGAWFAGDLLDSATVENGTIQIDYQHNMTLANTIAMSVSQSFSVE
jgi:hypothetical protein